jgi:hypothetical protein
MARRFAQIHTDIWEDPDFLALSSDARWVYVAAFSQKITEFCGVLVYSPARMAHVTGLPVRKVEAAVSELHRGGFVVLDAGTGEVWVRAFIKANNVLSQSQLRKAMERTWGEVLSQSIRVAITASLPTDYVGPCRQAAATLPEGFAEAGTDPASSTRITEVVVTPTRDVTRNPGPDPGLDGGVPGDHHAGAAAARARLVSGGDGHRSGGVAS